MSVDLMNGWVDDRWIEMMGWVMVSGWMMAGWLNRWLMDG